MRPATRVARMLEMCSASSTTMGHDSLLSLLIVWPVVWWSRCPRRSRLFMIDSLVVGRLVGRRCTVATVRTVLRCAQGPVQIKGVQSNQKPSRCAYWVLGCHMPHATATEAGTRAANKVGTRRSILELITGCWLLAGLAAALSFNWLMFQAINGKKQATNWMLDARLAVSYVRAINRLLHVGTLVLCRFFRSYKYCSYVL